MAAEAWALNATARSAADGARYADWLGQMGRHEEAIAAFERVAAAELPASVASVAWHNQGLSLVEVGRDVEAASAFGRCLKALTPAAPQRAEVEMKLGDALARAGEWSSSAEAYGRAWRLSGEAKAAANAGAATLNAEGDPRRALAYLEKAGAERRAAAHAVVAKARTGDAGGAEAALNGLGDDLALFAAMLLETAGFAALSLRALEGISAKGSTAYYRLVRSYSSMGREADAAATRRAAVAAGVWRHEWQQPGLLLDLPAATPWIDEGSEVRSDLQGLVGSLEAVVYPIALDEWRRAKNPNTLADDEGIATDKNLWRRLVLRNDGRWMPAPDFERTRRALEPLLDADRLPRGSVVISILKPGASLVPHSGPSNHRLRLHLALEAPEEGAFITVGDPNHAANTRLYRPGRCLVFDDSFLHSVANRGDVDRVVLLVDVWHPALSVVDRDAVRETFQYDARRRTNHRGGLLFLDEDRPLF